MPLDISSAASDEVTLYNIDVKFLFTHLKILSKQGPRICR